MLGGGCLERARMETLSPMTKPHCVNTYLVAALAAASRWDEEPAEEP